MPSHELWAAFGAQAVLIIGVLMSQLIKLEHRLTAIETRLQILEGMVYGEKRTEVYFPRSVRDENQS